MKAYMDYERRLQMTDTIVYHKQFTYDILNQLKEENRLENYDLFEIFTKGREDKEDLMFYKDGEFYYIESRSSTFKMIEAQLEGRTFSFSSQGDNTYENGVQRYLRKHSQEEFDNLDDRDKIAVITGTYIRDELNDILDGLKSTLQDIIEASKEEN